MTIRTTPPAYQTSDCYEFTDEGEATRHQELLDAQKAISAAEKRFAELMAAKMSTADGAPFSYDKRIYWQIERHYGGEPALCRFEVEPGIKCVVRKEDVLLSYGFNPERKALVSELYSDRQKAIAALKEVVRKYVAEVMERVNKSVILSQ